MSVLNTLLLRILRAMNYTIVLYVIAAVAVVLTLTSRTASEAIIDFCFGGIVPGTDHVLAPGVVITGVMVALGLIIVGVLSSWLLRVVAVKQAMKHVGLTLPALLEPSEIIAVPVAAVSGSVTKTSRPRSLKKTTSVASSHTYTLARWFAGLLRKSSTRAVDYAWIDRVQTAVLPVLRVIMAATIYLFISLKGIGTGTLRLLTSIIFAFIAIVAIVGDWLAVHIRASASRLWRKTVITTRALATFVRVQSTRFWRWLEPRASRFDTWLEIQYRTAVTWIKQQFGRSEPAQVLVTIAREISDTFRQLFK